MLNMYVKNIPLNDKICPMLKNSEQLLSGHFSSLVNKANGKFLKMRKFGQVRTGEGPPTVSSLLLKFYDLLLVTGRGNCQISATPPPSPSQRCNLLTRSWNGCSPAQSSHRSTVSGRVARFLDQTSPSTYREYCYYITLHIARTVLLCSGIGLTWGDILDKNA